MMVIFCNILKKKIFLFLGIEPTANTAKVAKEKGIESVVDFFGVRLAETLAAKGIQADLLLGNNVLAHVPDIIDFVGRNENNFKAARCYYNGVSASDAVGR